MKIINEIKADHPAYTGGLKIKPRGFVILSGTKEQMPVNMGFIPHAYIEEGIIYQELPWDRRSWHSHGETDSTHISIVVDKTCEALEELKAHLSKVYGLEEPKEEAPEEEAQEEEESEAPSENEEAPE